MSDTAGDLRGMILAAGYGTRLAPVTDHVPKPLLPVGGRPLLDRIVTAFDDAGIRDIAVNTHHLGEQITAHLAARADAARFSLFPEKEILGTGGALYGAREFLAGTDSFLLYNGDVLCDVDLRAVADAHRGHGALATLLLVDWPQVNTVSVTAAGAVVDLAGRPGPQDAVAGARSMTYAGVGAFSRELLADIGPGFSSLIDPLVWAMAAKPGSVRGFFPAAVVWNDLGTLPRLLRVQEDGTDEDAGPARIRRLTGHGSDRRFWRISAGDWSAVAMQSPDEDVEFPRQVAIASFLAEAGLEPPRTLQVHAAEQVLLSEDLGDERLFEVAAAGDPVRTIRLYEKAVDFLLRLQDLTPRAERECPLAADRSLDEAALREETNYFRSRYLVGHLGRDHDALTGLDDDFAALAAEVAQQPSVLIHRDFQSQNLHVAGDRIRPVDFQGMRRGPLGYDAAALIFDPYVDVGEQERTGLLTRFAAACGTARGLDPGRVRMMVLTAGLQRVMQALGAYGFLGHGKGKREFLAHIPAGRSRLAEIDSRLAAVDHPLAGRFAGF